MRLVRALLAALLLANAVPVVAQHDVADSLVGLWIDSLGGMDAYRKFQSATFTLTTELYDVKSGRLRYARPRYITIGKLLTGEASRIERWEGKDFIEQAFDGQSVQSHFNGQTLPDTAKDAREALYVARDVFYWFALPFKLRDPGVHLRYRGRTDGSLHRVAVVFGEGVGEHRDSWSYFFAPGRAWPVEVQYIEEGRTDVHRTRWEEIRAVDDYPYVARRVWFNEQGQIIKILRTGDVRLNPPLPPKRFRLP